MGEAFLTIIAIVLLVIQVILIVRFFKLCENVSAIRKSMIKVDVDAIVEHNKFKLFGHPEKAREVLENHIWNNLLYLKKNFNSEGRKIRYEKIKLELEPKLIEVGGKWPNIRIEDF